MALHLLEKTRPALRAAAPDWLIGLVRPGANLNPDASRRCEEEHAAKGWAWLSGPEERARYGVIASFVPPGSAVLDVGCGPGVLQPWLTRAGCRRYVGTDISPSAIEQARARAGTQPGVSFAVADASASPVEGQFDVIVFNEMLYYLPDPAAALRRYAAALAEGGHYVISLYSCRASTRTWSRARAAVCVLDTCIVRRSAAVWTVRLCTPRAA